MEHILVYACCNECSNNYIHFISKDKRNLVCPYCKSTREFWDHVEATSHKEEE